MWLCCSTVCGGGVREGTTLLPSLLGSCPFSHFSCYPISNWALLVLIPRWVDFVCYVGLSNKLSCEAGSFSCHCNPHRFFPSRGFEVFETVLELWIARSVSLPSYSSQFIHKQMWDHLLHQPLPGHLTLSDSCSCAVHPLHPGCLSPFLLPVWMNVSSLNPWLLDFHIIRFSGSSGCFLFLNLLLSFFWLCKETQCIYTSIFAGSHFKFYYQRCLELGSLKLLFYFIL